MLLQFLSVITNNYHNECCYCVSHRERSYLFGEKKKKKNYIDFLFLCKIPMRRPVYLAPNRVCEDRVVHSTVVNCL